MPANSDALADEDFSGMAANSKSHNDLKSLVLIVICIALNIICANLASILSLPFYFDCIGTIAASVIGGFMPGVLVGFLTNMLSSLNDNYTNLYYGVLNVLIALVAAGFSQKKYLRQLTWKMLIPVAYFVLIGGGLGSVITWGLFGDTLGEELASSLAGRIYTNVTNDAFTAQLFAGLIMDIPDKIISTLLAFMIYKFYPKKLKPERDLMNLAALSKRGISLSAKIVISVTLIFSIAAAVVSYVSFKQFKDTIVNSESEYAKDTVSFAATMIDGNMVDDYVSKQYSAEGFYRIKRYYNLILGSSDRIQRIYVYQMLEDGCHVVFYVDRNNSLEIETGDVLAYNEVLESHKEDFLAGRVIEEADTVDDEKGWHLSRYVPVYNSDGRIKCYVCIDVAMPNITDVERTFTFKTTTLLLGFFITVLTLSVYLAKRFIVTPVNNLAKLTGDFAYTNDKAREGTLESIKELEIKTGDEIEHLYKSIAKTTLDTVNYINESQRKNEAISTFQSGMISVMADLVESRDQSTGTHIKNTAEYVRIICDQMIEDGIYTDVVDEEYKNNVVSSAPMHDIGKIKISDVILNKPGKFTDEEYAIMKTHTEEGAKIIASVKKSVEHEELKENYLGEAENMAHYHHEKWDGSGYPCGLKGEEIPLSARIMSVADVFDALVAERVYKPAMPFEKALSIVKESSGKSFDPNVVEAFLHAEEKIRKVTSEIH